MHIFFSVIFTYMQSHRPHGLSCCNLALKVNWCHFSIDFIYNLYRIRCEAIIIACRAAATIDITLNAGTILQPMVSMVWIALHHILCDFIVVWIIFAAAAAAAATIVTLSLSVLFSHSPKLCQFVHTYSCPSFVLPWRICLVSCCTCSSINALSEVLKLRCTHRGEKINIENKI